MKKITLFFFIFSLVSFAGVTLYTFKLPPFKALNEQKFEEVKNSQLQEEAAEPASPKVKREITYEERIQKGDLLLKNKYYALAIKEYALASQMKPEKVESYIKIGKAHLDLKAYEKAIENFMIATEKDPENIEIKINLGRAYISQTEFTKARDVFQQINADNQMVKYYQALLSCYFKDYAKAKELFKRVTELNTTEEFTKNAQLFMKAFEEYDKTSGAQEIYLKTLIAKGLNEVKEFYLALGILKEVTKEMSSYRDAWILLGYAQLSLENYKEAVEAFKIALDLDSEKAETRYFLGLAYFGMDKTEEAITNLEIALKNGFEPKLQIYQKLAEMYLLKVDFANAIKNYEQVFAIQKDLQPDYFIRPIWIYIEYLNDPNKAVSLAEKVIQTHPNEAMSFNLLGWSYLANKDYDQALNNFNKALEIDPKLGAAYLNLGKLYEEKGELLKAKENYKKAFEMSQGDSVGNLAAERYNQVLKKEEEKK